jgi:amidohydrolase
MATSFHAEYGSGGRVVTYNAEYDALPDIGHACGHNLIAMTSIASFLGVAAALRESKIPGRVRLIGTPAEEEGGGKLQIIAAGAYDDVDACLMIHPSPVNPGWAAESKITGTAYGKSLANKKFKATFKGKSAHAGMAPYQGVNALDAAVLAYNGVSVLRQQIRPYDRLHAIIPDGGKQGNVITAKATAEYTARSATNKEVLALERRIKNCVHGAALATDCTVEVEELVYLTY